jgi:hypothetical protein
MTEILISERFYKRSNKIFQHFIYDKKMSKCLLDERYKIHEIFEAKIKEKALSLYFIQRREEKDRIILEYEITEEFEKPSNSYFVVAYEIPKYPGCDFCKFRQQCKECSKNSPFIYCEYKQKTLSHKLKTCKFFRQG